MLRLKNKIERHAKKRKKEKEKKKGHCLLGWRKRERHALGLLSSHLKTVKNIFYVIG